MDEWCIAHHPTSTTPSRHHFLLFFYFTINRNFQFEHHKLSHNYSILTQPPMNILQLDFNPDLPSLGPQANALPTELFCLHLDRLLCIVRYGRYFWTLAQELIAVVPKGACDLFKSRKLLISVMTQLLGPALPCPALPFIDLFARHWKASKAFQIKLFAVTRPV